MPRNASIKKLSHPHEICSICAGFFRPHALTWTARRPYSQPSQSRPQWQVAPREESQANQDGDRSQWQGFGQFSIPSNQITRPRVNSDLSQGELRERQALFERKEQSGPRIHAAGLRPVRREPVVRRTPAPSVSQAPRSPGVREDSGSGSTPGFRTPTQNKRPLNWQHNLTPRTREAQLESRPLQFRLHPHDTPQATTPPQPPPDAASWNLLGGSRGEPLGASHKIVAPAVQERDPKMEAYLQGREKRRQETRGGNYVQLGQQGCRICGSKEHWSMNCLRKTPMARHEGPSGPDTETRRQPATASYSPTFDSHLPLRSQPDTNLKAGFPNPVVPKPAPRVASTDDFYNPQPSPSRWSSERQRHSGMEEKPRRRPVVAKGRGHGDVSYSEAHVDRALRRTMKDLRRAEAAKKKRAEIILPEFISVSNLAQALGVPLDKFVNKMLELGFEDVNHDQVLTGEDAGLVAQEYGFNPQQTKDEDEKDLFPAPNPEDKSSWPQRPPVVTIMGHVDHGKTTLLDYLRKSSIAANEHGGITQHIGAFSVPLSSSGKTITFLDTPGHAAFLTMRERGANVTDIVILVVAADDSIMPQTLEAIKHAHAAKVPIIVAINKVDKEDANPRRVKQDLAVNGIEIEDFGGDTQAILVSGKTGQGMDELEEATVTLSEMLDNRADPDGKAEGWVLESSKKRDGLMATVLVRRGTLRPGDIIVAGKTWARVRRLMNEAGKPMKSVGPGMPAEIDGWRAQPEAGDEVLQAEDEQHAARVVDFRQAKADRQRMAKDMEAINEARKLVQERRKREKETADGKAKDQDRASEDAEKMGENTALTGPKTIPFIVKADVSGSVEAVVNVISGIGNAEVRPIIVRSAVGPVTETDLDFAAVAHGHIISFNTRVDPKFMVEAKRLGVDIFDQNIIYRVTEDIRAKLSEFLPPLVVQKVTGEAEIAQIFPINMKRNKQLFIAGCKVKNGVMTRNSKVKVLRNKDVIYQGSLSSLKNVKKDTTEMRKGTECGIGFDNWEDFKVGDQIQCYDESLEKRYL